MRPGRRGPSRRRTPSRRGPLAYETCQWTPPSGRGLTDAIYEGYSLQSIRISGAKPHPTALVQSAAMASVAPPQPSYRPHLPPRLVSECILSEAQLESVIYAGEAHGGHLTGAWKVDATFDTIAAAADDAEGAVRFRRGWFLGDGTGAGKGRQAAGIILDNWMQGRRRAVWISKSDKLIDDAQRDWSALGQERLQITPLARFRQGNAIRLDEGILFTTYATIRTQEREGKASRVQQIVDWLGKDFDGVIIFDEAHAMANAAGGKSIAAPSPPRSRAAPACGCSTLCPRPASSTSPPPVRPRSRTWLTRSASAFGAARISPSPPAPNSSRRSRPAASPPWKSWRAT